MTVPTVQITGNVLTPSGRPVASGWVRATLSVPGSVVDGSVTHRVASSFSGALGADGSLPSNFVLIPNDVILPGGTYYEVSFAVSTEDEPLSSPNLVASSLGRRRWTEKWQVASSPASVDVGSVPRIDAVPGVAIGLVPATETVTGGVRLAGDLGGSATTPEVNATHLTDPLPQAQGGTGAASLAAAGAVAVAGDIGGTAASPQVTATHLLAPLPEAQGGTGSATFLERHRAATVAENHVVHGWEVADATARAALSVAAADLGRVARQTDDGSLWYCTGHTPAAWQRLDPAGVDARVTVLEAVTIQTLLAAITHPPGYAAAADEFWVQGADVTAPTVTAFTLPATSDSLVIAVTTFTATDDVAVTGYIVTESATPPAAGAAGWSATAPTSITASGTGTIAFYAWAKDAAGNVSAALTDSVVVTVADTTPPTVTAFTTPATSDSLTIAISSFTATDAVGVTGFMVTESGTPPSAGAAGWVSPAPTTYTTATEGAKTLRGWAKDAAGNVSAAVTSACTVTLARVATPTSDVATGTYNADQTVTLSCATSGSEIRYTTDGSAPTAASTLYSAPLSVTATTTLRAIGVKSGMVDSAIATFTITLQVATPTFDPAAGSYGATQTVTIATTTSGAAIRYTTDGTTPDGSSTLYSAPISVATTQTVKAIGTKTGYTNSAVASAAYALPAASITNGGFESDLSVGWTILSQSPPNSVTERVGVTGGLSPYAGSYMVRLYSNSTPTIGPWQMITGAAWRAGTGAVSVRVAADSNVPTDDANQIITLAALAYSTAHPTDTTLLLRRDYRLAGNLNNPSGGTNNLTKRAALTANTWAEYAWNLRSEMEAAGLVSANVDHVHLYLQFSTANALAKSAFFDALTYG